MATVSMLQFDSVIDVKQMLILLEYLSRCIVHVSEDGFTNPTPATQGGPNENGGRMDKL